MTMLRAVAEGREYVTLEADPADSWDRDNTQFDLSEVYVELAQPGSRHYGMYDENFVLDNASPGDRVHVVYVQYTTGDTFGQDCGRITFMDIFPEGEGDKAQRLANALRDCKEWELEFEGKNYYVPFNGYFESLEDVAVASVTVRK